MQPSVSAPQVYPQYDLDRSQSGVYGTPGNLPPGSTVAVVANRAFLLRFTVSRPMTILSGAFGVSVAANNDDACDIGIYDATLANLLASAGTTTGKLNSLGRKLINLQASVTLVPRTVYYSAFIGALAGTAATLAAASVGSASFADLFGTTTTTSAPTPVVPHCEGAFFAGSAATLGASGALTATSAYPGIAWREF